jgi:hypothetical protein
VSFFDSIFCGSLIVVVCVIVDATTTGKDARFEGALTTVEHESVMDVCMLVYIEFCA